MSPESAPRCPRCSGYHLRNCPLPKGTAGKCFVCDKLGHVAKDCPERQQKNKLCFRCGQPGHTRKECPQPRKNKAQHHEDAIPLDVFIPHSVNQLAQDHEAKVLADKNAQDSMRGLKEKRSITNPGRRMEQLNLAIERAEIEATICRDEAAESQTALENSLVAIGMKSGDARDLVQAATQRVTHPAVQEDGATTVTLSQALRELSVGRGLSQPGTRDPSPPPISTHGAGAQGGPDNE